MKVLLIVLGLGLVSCSEEHDHTHTHIFNKLTTLYDRLEELEYIAEKPLTVKVCERYIVSELKLKSFNFVVQKISAYRRGFGHVKQFSECEIAPGLIITHTELMLWLERQGGE